jgi:hypothetical protein
MDPRALKRSAVRRARRGGRRRGTAYGRDALAILGPTATRGRLAGGWGLTLLICAERTRQAGRFSPRVRRESCSVREGSKQWRQQQDTPV